MGVDVTSKDSHLEKDQQILHLKDPNWHGRPDDENTDKSSPPPDKNSTPAHAKLAEGWASKETSESSSQFEQAIDSSP